MYQDESTFYTNEDGITWVRCGMSELRDKTRGTSVMISGYICRCHGIMITTDSLANLTEEDRRSYLVFEAGSSRDGWFTGDDLVN